MYSYIDRCSTTEQNKNKRRWLHKIKPWNTKKAQPLNWNRLDTQLKTHYIEVISRHAKSLCPQIKTRYHPQPAVNLTDIG